MLTEPRMNTAMRIWICIALAYILAILVGVIIFRALRMISVNFKRQCVWHIYWMAKTWAQHSRVQGPQCPIGAKSGPSCLLLKQKVLKRNVHIEISAVDNRYEDHSIRCESTHLSLCAMPLQHTFSKTWRNEKLHRWSQQAVSRDCKSRFERKWTTYFIIFP